MKKSELKEMIKSAMMAEGDNYYEDGMDEGNNYYEDKVDEGLLDFLKKKKAEAPKPKSGSNNEPIGVDYDGNYIYANEGVTEAKKVEVEDDENIDVDIEKNVKVDDESTESDIEVDTMMPGESETEQAVQGLLLKAQEEAAKLSDEKLTDQIGNTITYFTRAHISQVDEAEDYNSDVADISMDNPAEDAEVGFALEESLRFQKLAGIIKEELPAKKEPSEVVTLKKYLEGSGSTSLKAINNQQELKSILGVIFNNMADSMKKNSNAMKVLDIINARLK